MTTKTAEAVKTCPRCQGRGYSDRTGERMPCDDCLATGRLNSPFDKRGEEPASLHRQPAEKDSQYQSAVKGRSEFRQAYSDARRQLIEQAQLIDSMNQTNAAMGKRLSEQAAEITEQCRLNAMGQEREAALLAKVGTQAALIERLEDELRICQAQFCFYAREHRKAEKHEKAATNQTFADRCFEALSAVAKWREGRK